VVREEYLWICRGGSEVLKVSRCLKGTGSDVGLIQIRPRRLHIHVAGFWMFGESDKEYHRDVLFLRTCVYGI
jgi:hypothetical protein